MHAADRKRPVDRSEEFSLSLTVASQELHFLSDSRVGHEKRVHVSETNAGKGCTRSSSSPVQKRQFRKIPMQASLLRAICAQVIVVALLGGCAATGPVFRPVEKVNQGDGLIYVYRADAFAGGGRSTPVYVDDVHVFDLRAGGYSWFSVPAGRYKLRQDLPWDLVTQSNELVLDVRPGETSFYSVSTEVGDCKIASKCIRWILRNVNGHVGQSEIEDKRFQENAGLEQLRQKLKD